MNKLPVCMREIFEKVRPFVIRHKEQNRQPIDPLAPQGEEAQDYVDAYVGLDTIHEDALMMRYPPLSSGVDSRFHAAIDQNGALWGVLVRRLCDHRDRTLDPRTHDRKSTSTDGIVPKSRLEHSPQINKVPMFLTEEVRILRKTRFMSPRAVMYSENQKQEPKKAYLVVPLHGRTLQNATPLLISDLTNNSRTDTPNGPQLAARRIFARNICYDVWLNLKALNQADVRHFDFKADNFFLKMDSSRGLRCTTGNALPTLPPASDSSYVFGLGDYGHAVRRGNPQELLERTVSGGFGQDVSGSLYNKKLLGTVEYCHPDVFQFDGEPFARDLPLQGQTPRFAVSHNVDRFSAGLMLAGLFQTFRLAEDGSQAQDPLLFDQIRFAQDRGMPDAAHRSPDPIALKKQIYQSNAAVFRKVTRGSFVSTETPAENDYARNWVRFFRELDRFDHDVAQMILSLLFLPANAGDDLVGDAPHVTEPFFTPSFAERSAFRQSLERIGSFDEVTASHLKSLVENRKELFQLAHNDRQTKLAENSK